MLPEVRAGQWLEAQGRWIVNREYGRQFQAGILRTMPPTTVEGIEKYLASGMIKGIGPVLAGRIVKVYKERTFEVIDADPHSLTYVEGIGPTRKKKITTAWQEQKAIREIMVFLHGHKVSTSRAFRIFKAYGNEAIDKVRQDPYRLARDIQGIGFKTADVIAESVGIGKQSDLRARAGVEYTLLQLTEKGHCGYGREELVAMAVTLLEIPDEIIETAVGYLLQDKRIVARTLDSDAGGQPAVFLAGLEGPRNCTDQRAEIVISHRARPLHPVITRIAENLAGIQIMRVVRVTPGFLSASSETSGARRCPVTKPGHPTAVGVSLIFDEKRKEIQFFEITSAVKGCGARMVEAVVNALPRGWKAVVVMDWSEGFWEVMRQRHRRIKFL